MFSVVPGLELNKAKKVAAPKEDDDDDNNDAADDKQNGNGSANNGGGWELFALRRDLLTADSNITQIGVHRKLFNDCFVNFLKNKVL